MCGELPRPEAGVGVAPPLMNTFLCYSTVKQACHGVLVVWIDMHSERFCWKKKKPLKSNSETESRMTDASGWGRETCSVGTDFQFCKVKQFWRLVIQRCERCFSSVSKSCLTLSDLIDCTLPGLPVPYHLSEFAQVHVH